MSSENQDNLDKKVLEYMLTTDEVIQEYKEAAAQEKTRADEAEAKVTVLETQQKEASAVAPEFATEAVSATVDKCVEAGFIHQSEKEAHVEVIQKDPSKALELLTKLAAGTLEASQARSIGTVVEKTASQTSYGKNVNKNRSEADLFFESKFQV